jgi:hypothetical protein
MSLKEQIDILTESEEEKDDGIDKMMVHVHFPPVLQAKILGNNESVINLLQIAAVAWNDQLTKNPTKGFGHIVFFLNSERVEHDFRVHLVYFSPTIDLENTNMTALISSTNNKELKRYIDDGVLSFYLSGKIVQKNNGEICSISISKLSTKVDQTAYAKRYQKRVGVDDIKNNIKFYRNILPPPAFPETEVVVDVIPKRLINPNDPFELENIKSFKDEWKRFANEREKYETNKKIDTFNEWRQLAKKKIDVDSKK